MNNFDKVYTVEKLKKHRLVSVLTLPLEESIMFPVSQMIHLMKNGKNVAFFSFEHDSIKVNQFLKEMLSKEDNVENIKGNIAILDSHQIKEGEDVFEYISSSIRKIKKDFDLNFVFFDGIDNYKKYVSKIDKISTVNNITSILIKSLNPKGTEFKIKNLLDNCSSLTHSSNYIIAVQRNKENNWKKIINFLLFWRKRNNFTIEIIKDRLEGEKKFRLSMDLDNFVLKIL